MLQAPHVELDQLFWGPAWTPKPSAEFRDLVQAAAAAPRWVADGNYSRVRDLLWPRATTIVWLNCGFATVLSRAMRRTIGRIIRRETLFAGNTESVRRSFLSRKEYGALRHRLGGGTIEWIEFRGPGQAETFLGAIDARP